MTAATIDVSLNDVQRAEFQEQGCVVLRGLLSSEQLQEARRCFDEARYRPTKKFAPSTYLDGSLYNSTTGYQTRNQVFMPLLARTPILEAVRQLWEKKGGSTTEEAATNIWLYGHEIFHKQYNGDPEEFLKATASHTPFHQDTHAREVCRGMHQANVWIPFEELPEENALQVVKRSHLGPVYNVDGLISGATKSVPLPVPGRELLPAFADWTSKLGWEIFSPRLSPGDVVVLHPLCIHGGGPCSPECPERNALVFRLFGDDCCYHVSTEEAVDRRLYEKHGLKEGDPFSRAFAKNHLLGPGNNLARLLEEESRTAAKL